MRIIVSLYRSLVPAFLLGASAGLAYLIGFALSSLPGAPSDAFGALGLLGSIALFLLLILFISVTATFISIHDKFSEFVDAILKDR